MGREVYLGFDEEMVQDEFVYNAMVKKQSILDKDPGYKESISKKEEPEVTIICVDNSFMVTSFRGGGVHKSQVHAIAVYAYRKINAHIENQVGLMPMGAVKDRCWVSPTRDLKKILSPLKGKKLEFAGQPFIPVYQALSYFFKSELPKRRLLLFFGGRLHTGSVGFSYYANQLKQFNIAVDVVNFGLQFLPPSKHTLLENFAKEVNNDNNIHYLYAPSGSKASLAKQIISSPLVPGGLTKEAKMVYDTKEDQKIENAKSRAEKKAAKKKKKMEQQLAPPGGLPMQEEKKTEQELKLLEETNEAAAPSSRPKTKTTRAKKKADKRQKKMEQKEIKMKLLAEEEEKRKEEEEKRKEEKVKNKNKKMYQKKKERKLRKRMEHELSLAQQENLKMEQQLLLAKEEVGAADGVVGSAS